MKIKLYLLHELSPLTIKLFSHSSQSKIDLPNRNKRYFNERISSKEMSSSITATGVPGQGVEGEGGERGPDLLAHPRRPGGRQQEPELPPVVRQLDGVGDLGAGPAAAQLSARRRVRVCGQAALSPGEHPVVAGAARHVVDVGRAAHLVLPGRHPPVLTLHLNTRGYMEEHTRALTSLKEARAASTSWSMLATGSVLKPQGVSQDWP